VKAVYTIAQVVAVFLLVSVGTYFPKTLSFPKTNSYSENIFLLNSISSLRFFLQSNIFNSTWCSAHSIIVMTRSASFFDPFIVLRTVLPFTGAFFAAPSMLDPVVFSGKKAQ